MIPVKAVDVHLPAEFNENDVPLGQAVEFKVAGTAGQFLCIDAAEIYRVEVQPPDGGPALKFGWGPGAKAYYALPRTGTYRVLYAPANHAEIKFSSLAADDPIANPGIKPEQFSVDLGTITKQELSIVPYTFDDGEDYLDSWPTHLGVVNDSFEFHVIAVAGYKKMFGEHQYMDNLAAVLSGGGTQLKMNKSPSYYTIPYPSYKDGGMNMTARRQSLSGDGWHGLRWIGAFGQDIGCAQDWAYVFEGISNDGKYFVLIRAAIANPRAEKRFAQECGENRNAKLDPIFERAMTEAEPASFTPNLNDLDGVVKSFKIRQ